MLNYQLLFETILNRSYIEAIAAVEHGRIKGDSEIISFSEMHDGMEQVYWYPIEQQTRFIQSLKQGDKTVATENLRCLMEVIDNRKTSVIMYKYVCFDIVNMVAKAIDEYKADMFAKDVYELMEFKDLGELETKLNTLIIKYCEYVEKCRGDRNVQVGRAITEYVTQNYRDSNLSLEILSERFKLSQAHLSRFFKEFSGQTFTDFLIDLRMQEAKKMLACTDKTLKDVVEHIGYIDVPSFLRKFKKIEGLTPGEYRQRHHFARTEN